MMNSKCVCGSGCAVMLLTKVLLVIGGLNWGLVGLGMLMGESMASWNVVHMVLGSWPMVEAIVYVLVGLAAIVKLIGCRCAQCKALCAVCASTGPVVVTTETKL